MTHIQGIQDNQVKVVLKELEEMMPTESKWIAWAQTKNYQGPWPKKTMVSLWCMHGTGKQVSLLKKPLSRAQVMFYRAFRTAKGDKSKMKAV